MLTRNLIAESTEAIAWMDGALDAYASGGVFGQLASSVIWSSATDDDGNLLIPIDPKNLAATINAEPFPLLMDHDPGRPVGKVLAAEVFEAITGETFVAAVLGFYGGAPKLTFRDLGLDTSAVAPSPAKLPALPEDFRVSLSADPKEVETEWLEELIRSAPVRVELEERSHNAADGSHDFIAVGVLFMALVWNPFVTTFANEASKDAYAAVRGWLKNCLSDWRNAETPSSSYKRTIRVA